MPDISVMCSTAAVHSGIFFFFNFTYYIVCQTSSGFRAETTFCSYSKETTPHSYPPPPHTHTLLTRFNVLWLNWIISGRCHSHTGLIFFFFFTVSVVLGGIDLWKISALGKRKGKITARNFRVFPLFFLSNCPNLTINYVTTNDPDCET